MICCILTVITWGCFVGAQFQTFLSRPDITVSMFDMMDQVESSHELRVLYKLKLLLMQLTNLRWLL